MWYKDCMLKAEAWANAEMETPSRRAQRLLLKTDKSVISAVEQVMSLFRTNAEGVVTKEAYMEIHVKILRALIPAFKGDYAAVGEVLRFTFHRSRILTETGGLGVGCRWCLRVVPFCSLFVHFQSC